MTCHCEPPQGVKQYQANEKKDCFALLEVTFGKECCACDDNTRGGGALRCEWLSARRGEPAATEFQLTVRNR